MGQMAIKKNKKKTKVTFGNIGRGALIGEWDEGIEETFVQQ